MTHKNCGRKPGEYYEYTWNGIPTKIIGRSSPMKKIFGLIPVYGPIDVPVVFEGETGTGKGLLAQAFHSKSGRRGGFYVYRCPPSGKWESTYIPLLGVEKGRFTLIPGSIGLIEKATNGTKPLI